MKRILRILIVCVVFLFVADWYVSGKLSAQTQTPPQSPGICYSQCGIYKFYWKGDFCYDMIQQQCSASFNLKDVVSLVKSIRKGFLSGKYTQIVDVKPLFTAWLICKPLIEDCIVPQLSACENTCQSNTVAYAPNLSTGGRFGQFHGLYYDDDKKTLTMRVMNNGLGYAWDIGVVMNYGSTSNQDGSGLVGGSEFSETIPELLFFGSRQSTPKSVGDIVTDFLIDESNISKYLSFLKSDADNVYIPPIWEKTIPFTAPEGKLTKITLVADPNQDIVETSETDNSYTLEIDKRPHPATFDIQNIELLRQGSTLTNYLAKFTIYNDGELPGNASVSVYEGNTTSGNAIYQETKRIEQKGTTTLNSPITVDISTGSPSCSRSKRFTVVVTDEQGVSRSSVFDVPLLAGQISGRVTTVQGKSVKDAVVMVSSGQTAKTSDYGMYRINGIGELGDITVTITHPSYTETVTKHVTLSLPDSQNLLRNCSAEGLNIQNVNATLRDIPTKLTIKLKNTDGTPLNGTVLLTGEKKSVSYEVSGQKTIEEADVGQFSVTASSPGYITKFVQSVLTPPEQTLEIVLTSLYGRESDNGLKIISPKKLWQKTFGTGKVDAIKGSKDGKLLVVYTSKNTADSGVLTFVDPITGKEISHTSVPATKGQQQVGLDVSYDGRTVGYMVNPGSVGKTESERIVMVFGKNGNLLGQTTAGNRNSPAMVVSPDGFYVYPNFLMNSSLHKYTRHEMEGVGEKALQGYTGTATIYFTRDHTIIGDCKSKKCIKSFADKEIKIIGDPKAAARVIDMSYDGSSILFRTDKTLAYFGIGSWEKEFKRDNKFVSAAITPGGTYTIVADGNGSSQWMKLTVLSRDGSDVTPKFKYKDVGYVEANDRGMFFSQITSNTVSYYQIAEYANEYKPPKEDDVIETQATNSLKMYDNERNEFVDAGILTWDSMSIGSMYKTNEPLTLSTPWGKLILSKDTIITKSSNGFPILVWGQAEVEASQPITLIAIKNKLYKPGEMAGKVNSYISGSLPADQFVAITNLHTTYSASSGSKGIAVIVKKGDIRVVSNNTDTSIKTGQILEISQDGKVKQSSRWYRYILSAVVFLCICCVCIAIVSIYLRKIHRKKAKP